MKIYFTASTSHNGELMSQYNKIFEYIKKHEVTILSGQQVVNSDTLKQDKQLSAVEIYNREKKLIDQSDFIIAEVSKPSLGVGSEIVYALTEGKPVLALVRTDFEDRISPMLLGNPSENLFLEFYRETDFTKIIDKFIKHIKIIIDNLSLLRKTKGKLIVIDGGDGSGKTTQVSLLMDYLKKEHIPSKIVDFPQYYKSFHGKTVARFLRGEFGNLNEVSPYLAALSYALDRATAKNDMDQLLKKGGVIVANRYTTSSMAHHGAKFTSESEQNQFIEWISELEYNELKVPKENIVLYLYVPWKIGYELTNKKQDRSYLLGKKQDIHESNLSYRKKVEEMYLKLAKRNKHWMKIDCVKNNQILSPETIHKKIITALKSKKIIS